MSEIAAMNIREAVEAMKIIAPFAEQITETDNPAKIIRLLLHGFRDTYPTEALRLVALMEHKAVEDLADEMAEASGIDLIERMTDGLRRNDLINLMNAAVYLGIATHRWDYGD